MRATPQLSITLLVSCSPRGLEGCICTPHRVHGPSHSTNRPPCTSCKVGRATRPVPKQGHQILQQRRQDWPGRGLIRMVRPSCVMPRDRSCSPTRGAVGLARILESPLARDRAAEPRAPSPRAAFDSRRRVEAFAAFSKEARLTPHAPPRFSSELPPKAAAEGLLRVATARPQARVRVQAPVEGSACFPNRLVRFETSLGIPRRGAENHPEVVTDSGDGSAKRPCSGSKRGGRGHVAGVAAATSTGSLHVHRGRDGIISSFPGRV